MTFAAASIQNNATPDLRHDVEVLSRLVDQGAAAGAQFIATPEYRAGLDVRDGELAPVAHDLAEHPAITAMAHKARQHGV